eukprot:CAMPEP_0178446886 /NCGR_PEP_ID=MMETSP0689_2-20121128/41071_1 /TAXON_ID=160604 /ORGANISM="Amphidinium massartii, Strain CS-259" /LENGTH=131 /DNA_ID=CAMNT_0020071797 /DNA_START=27 /DNA_END=419 /DNA_ORIENTATION=+
MPDSGGLEDTGDYERQAPESGYADIPMYPHENKLVQQIEVLSDQRTGLKEVRAILKSVFGRGLRPEPYRGVALDHHRERFIKYLLQKTLAALQERGAWQDALALLLLDEEFGSQRTSFLGLSSLQTLLSTC